MKFSSNMKKLYTAVIIIAASGFLFFLSLASPVVLNNSDFSIYNTQWNGCSRLAMETYETGKFTPLLSYNTSTLTPIQYSFVDYECSPQNTSICIIGPQKSFTRQDADYIHWFLTNGGIVFLADDFGSANTLLQQLNTTTRISNKLLLDFSFEKNVSFVVLYNFQQDRQFITQNLSRILTNYPSSLNVSQNATILVNSSNFSWLDTTYNGKYDTEEEKGPYPLLSIENYERGTLIVCSDPSIFINSMRPYADNLLFIEQMLVSLTKDRDSIIIDESHRDVAVPFTVAVTFPKTIDTTVKIFIIILIAALYLFFFTPIPKKCMRLIVYYFPQFNKRIKDIKEMSLADEILQEHPQWDKKTLESIIDRLENT